MEEEAIRVVQGYSIPGATQRLLEVYEAAVTAGPGARASRNGSDSSGGL